MVGGVKLTKLQTADQTKNEKYPCVLCYTLLYSVDQRLHVRRGDKLKAEMSKHEVKEYMKYAESWFTSQDREGEMTPRQVYLATDNPKVFKSIKER